MRGAGTQSDPYVPEKNNWAEFITAITSGSGHYVSLEEGSVYDLNAIAPNGFSSNGLDTISLQCAGITGNGAVIKNLYCASKIAFHTGGCPNGFTIKGLKFVNCYLENSPLMRSRDGGWAQPQTVTFEDCTFAGTIFKSNLLQTYNYSYWRLYRCTLDFIVSDSFIHNGLQGGYSLTDCHLNFIGSVNSGTNSCDAFSYLTRCTFTTILEISETGEYIWGTLTLKSSIELRMQNSILNKFDGYFKSSMSIYACGSSTHNLFNTTKNSQSGIPSMPASPIIIKCTEEQINDAEYLLSQGFPVGV